MRLPLKEETRRAHIIARSPALMKEAIQSEEAHRMCVYSVGSQSPRRWAGGTIKSTCPSIMDPRAAILGERKY